MACAADPAAVAASSDDPSHPSKWVFTNERIIGNGSFGVVYQAVVKQNQKARLMGMPGPQHLPCGLDPPSHPARA